MNSMHEYMYTMRGAIYMYMRGAIYDGSRIHMFICLVKDPNGDNLVAYYMLYVIHKYCLEKIVIAL